MGQLGPQPVAPSWWWPGPRGSGGILCHGTLLVCELVFQTSLQTGTARNRVAQKLGPWAEKSDRCEGFQSEHCLLQASYLRQIALCTYKQVRIIVGIELSRRTYKTLLTVVGFPWQGHMG